MSKTINPVNPYITGNPVTGTEMFFGREDVFLFVEQSLVGQYRDNVLLLHGQKRSGKTSVLYQMHRHLGPDYLCILIDLSAFQLKSFDNFLLELAQRIRSTLYNKYGIDLPQLDETAFQVGSRRCFEDVFLVQACRTIGKRRLFLMFDEVIRLDEKVRAGDLEPEVFEYLRYLMQHNEQVDFLFAISSNPQEQGAHPGFSRLFSGALSMNISFLDRSSATALITKPVTDYYQFGPSALDRILQITSGHPYYTQLLCHMLFSRWQQRNSSQIHLNDVDAILDEAVGLGKGVLAPIWKESTPDEKAIIAAMADSISEIGGTVKYEALERAWSKCDVTIPEGVKARAIESLVARDIVANQGAYAFTVDLLRLWVRKFKRLEIVKEEIADNVREWSRSTATLHRRPSRRAVNSKVGVTDTPANEVLDAEPKQQSKSDPHRFRVLKPEEIPPFQTQIHSARIIVASNDGPIEYLLGGNGSLKSRRATASAMARVAEALEELTWEITWVAMAATEGDRMAVKKAQQNGGITQSPLRGQNMKLRYVAISKSAYYKYYDRISNGLLWFLQHSLYDPDHTPVHQPQEDWINGYAVANQVIADAVNAEIEREESSAVVMLHDYHLYLVAAMIRKCHPSAVIQQFIHIPWPDIRYWHFLPINITHAIFSGLVGNDIIGFQTERDARNFLEGARTLLEGAVVDFEEGAIWWQGQRTQVRTYPISISVTGERKIVQSIAGRRAAEKIWPLLGEKTIMRVDRIEPTKNIVRGFQAYDLMLEEHPELRGKVKFLAFLVPSRQTLGIYQRYNADVMQIIDDINKKYGTDEWTPIHAFCENDRTRALAAMQFYDVLLVNPIIDGMNLVAKEGPVVNQRNGVLVLSRTVGAFQQLGKVCIPTSPMDTTETARALYKALTLLPEERHIKAVLARQIVEHNDLNKWLTRQIRDLNELLARHSAHPPLEPLLAALETPYG